MPKVNGKHYSYTKAGKEAADKEAKKTGKKVKMSKKGESTLQKMFEKEQDEMKCKHGKEPMHEEMMDDKKKSKSKKK